MDDKDRMQVTMEGLEQIFPGCAIALLVAPSGARVNWVSNAYRPDMLKMLREIIARFEGRAHNAPKQKQ